MNLMIQNVESVQNNGKHNEIDHKIKRFCNCRELLISFVDTLREYERSCCLGKGLWNFLSDGFFEIENCVNISIDS